MHFEKVDQDLFDQCGIHGKHKEGFGHIYPDLYIRQPLAKPQDGFGDDLLDNFRGFLTRSVS